MPNHPTNPHLLLQLKQTFQKARNRKFALSATKIQRIVHYRHAVIDCARCVLRASAVVLFVEQLSCLFIVF